MPNNNNNSGQTQKINTNLSDETRSFATRIDEVRSLVEENLRYTKSIKQSTLPAEVGSQKELRQLLQENLKISKELYGMTKKIKRWITFQRIWGVVKILIIIIPIILGLVYLPSLIRNVIEPYRELLNNDQNNNTQNLIQQMTEQLKK